ncbi:MAG: hypothetical protein DVB31_02980 [Verrucomicrobia bacterium]|nr:MAG: hypothetical protein DVB31_02980 [Verrucomicrobiota bacterium]
MPAAWLPDAGSHVFFCPDPWATPGGAGWEVAEVTSVAGSVLTLATPLAGTYAAGGCCWEVLCGKLQVDASEDLTGATARYGLSVSAYRGAVVPYSSAVPTIGDSTGSIGSVEDPYRVPVTELPPTLSRVVLLDSNLYVPAAQLLALNPVGGPVTSARSPFWEISEDDGATWIDPTGSEQTVIEETTAGYWRLRMPFNAEVLCRFTITWWGRAVVSGAITIPAVTVERTMRYLQERYHEVTGSMATWPNRTDGHAPGDYPADGFYAADIVGSPTREAALWEAIRQVCRQSTFYAQYLTTTGAVTGGLATGVVAPETNAGTSTWTWSPGGGFISPSYLAPLNALTALPTAVTSANVTIWRRNIAIYALTLHKTFRRTEQANRLSKVGLASQASGDMKPVILTTGGLGDVASGNYGMATPVFDAGRNIGIATVINPASVTTYAWGQTYNAPGAVELSSTSGSLQVDLTAGTASTTLSDRDLCDLPSLANAIRNQTRPIDLWVASQMSGPTTAALAGYTGILSDPVPLQAILVADLNALVNGASIYSSGRFAGVTLRSATSTLLATSPTGDDLKRLNRLLLEDAYPQVARSLNAGEASVYLSTYYFGYSLSQIGVVGQDGLTPYHTLTPTDITDVYYVGSGAPINIPAPAPGAHTKFALLATVPADSSYTSPVYCGTTSAPFFWLDVFNTTSRPLRDLHCEVVGMTIRWRSPDVQSMHWNHYLHVSA